MGDVRLFDYEVLADGWDFGVYGPVGETDVLCFVGRMDVIEAEGVRTIMFDDRDVEENEVVAKVVSTRIGQWAEAGRGVRSIHPVFQINMGEPSAERRDGGVDGRIMLGDILCRDNGVGEGDRRRGGRQRQDGDG